MLVGLLTVVDVRPLTSTMVRIGFTGSGLSVLDTWPDQQLKLCIPKPDQREPRLPESDPDDVMSWYQAFMAIPEAERPWMRSFTVRRLTGDRMEIDFVLGDHGPAARWATTARPGDVVGRYGPSADYRRPLPAADWYLFAGDETAVPATATLLESLPEARTMVWLAASPQPMPGPVQWVSSPEEVVAAVRSVTFPPGSGAAWLAGEAGLVRASRRSLVERGMPKSRIEFTGYWRRALSQDDAPTAADLAEAQERLSG
ncbi:siderophore-interacting protein [Labedaea rhizosphaerae]|uniref:NADPH-dependent ferric siderophore reductase n=1 Tax=Labedaea rhizosphaerae TaxID=598644 RepID=A0A4R6SM78_LABRH|nr:siderophore-interacting protein [Labedaea rhizosphaerae]TDQ04422.1 NADPH-dependent ferric siderophore reductase [Labedaea rhizosphaerae]